jgi:pimeloyl-ACP methyl ester carboxylesterase
MHTHHTSAGISHDRRRFLGTAAAAIAAVPLGVAGGTKAQEGRAGTAGLPAVKVGTNASFGPVKQINAGVLNVGTTFLSAATPRNADQAAFALDILALTDALKIDKAILAGYDWGSRTGGIIAALWPQQVKALVSVTRLPDHQPRRQQTAAPAEE